MLRRRYSQSVATVAVCVFSALSACAVVASGQTITTARRDPILAPLPLAIPSMASDPAKFLSFGKQQLVLTNPTTTLTSEVTVTNATAVVITNRAATGASSVKTSVGNAGGGEAIPNGKYRVRIELANVTGSPLTPETPMLLMTHENSLATYVLGRCPLTVNPGMTNVKTCEATVTTDKAFAIQFEISAAFTYEATVKKVVVIKDP